MAEQGLHVANVVAVFEHGDGGGAAEVMGHDAASDSQVDAEGAEMPPELVVVRGVGVHGASSATAVANPELPDVRDGACVVTLGEESGDFSRDGEGLLGSVLGGEAKIPAVRVVVGRRNLAGGSAAHAE